MCSAKDFDVTMFFAIEVNKRAKKNRFQTNIKTVQQAVEKLYPNETKQTSIGDQPTTQEI